MLHGARIAARALVTGEPGRSYIDTLDAVLARLVDGIPLADAPIAGRPETNAVEDGRGAG